MEYLLCLAIPHDLATRAWILVAALLVDSAFPDARVIWQRLPHPVVVFGHAIAGMEQSLNRPSLPAWIRILAGVIAIALLVALAIAAAVIIIIAASAISPLAVAGAEFFFLVILLAARSLNTHVYIVVTALGNNNVKAARDALAKLVGRNTRSMQKPAIVRAAIETTAENFSDGVIAPALFYCAFGLAGIFAYKMINTADSMTGYRNSRYHDYGWGAARLDDLANIIPARMTVFAIALSAPNRFLHILKVAWRDGQKHPSPNAGLPMAAMAGAINIALGGARHYGKRKVDYGMIHDRGKATPDHHAITRALNIMWRGIAVFALIIMALALA